FRKRSFISQCISKRYATSKSFLFVFWIPFFIQLLGHFLNPTEYCVHTILSLSQFNVFIVYFFSFILFIKFFYFLNIFNDTIQFFIYPSLTFLFIGNLCV